MCPQEIMYTVMYVGLDVVYASVNSCSRRYRNCITHTVTLLVCTNHETRVSEFRIQATLNTECKNVISCLVMDKLTLENCLLSRKYIIGYTSVTTNNCVRY